MAMYFIAVAMNYLHQGQGYIVRPFELYLKNYTQGAECNVFAIIKKM